MRPHTCVLSIARLYRDKRVSLVYFFPSLPFPPNVFLGRNTLWNHNILMPLGKLMSMSTGFWGVGQKRELSQTLSPVFWGDFHLLGSLNIYSFRDWSNNRLLWQLYYYYYLLFMIEINNFVIKNIHCQIISIAICWCVLVCACMCVFMYVCMCV